MKKMARASLQTIILLLAVFVIGCASTSPNSKNGPNHQYEKSTDTVHVSKINAVEKYPFPQDFDSDAYKYRTGIPHKQIVNFIENDENDSLRQNETERYVTNLTSLIDSVAKNDFEKVKMIYDALALLLDYDRESYISNSQPPSKWDYVLASRKAVCEGYANAFKKLCDMLKIPCETVHGYARGLTHIPANEEITSNHAWNIVKIDKFWYNVDCTWGSSAFNVNTSKSNHRYTTDWLFLKGDHFGYSHFPNDSNHQLTKKISRDEFKNRPLLDPIFFDLFESPNKLQATNNIDSSYQLDLIQKRDAKFILNVYDLQTNQPVQNRALLTHNREKLQIEFQAPYAGIFQAFLMHNVKDNAYSSIASFSISANKASNIQHPTYFHSSAKDIKIESPLVQLHADSTYEFKIKVSNKKYALLFCNGKKNRLKNQGNGFFSKKIKIPSNATEVLIEVSDTEHGRYEAIAKYPVTNNANF